ncbi:MAG: DNA mismatch repair protein MutT [Betaproteobacteria bacterium RIFCSPLOWO2_12_FULL_63_13]|nr:MAG: DNA mismatch repair protein MutT [Betaproteobacteria bacterium RIFCSPLOWO2_02_FULL_63_19]OGA53457.1 MAG: DNA mismatch repair protein MutT [Betaproteobacteria bacterium RIFCSPLOWO2_12_FULL_63_13]
MTATVQVAVAVLIRQDGCVLLARRPPGNVYAGYWEFPGGKIEPGESAADALAREIREELAVEIEIAHPWITRSFTYPHAKVQLHFHRVLAWRGQPRAVVHDGLSWERPGSVGVAPLLPANGPVFNALLLADEYAISQAAELGAEYFLRRLHGRLEAGLKLVQVREPALSASEFAALAAEVVRLAHAADARVLVNGDVALAREIGADGVHLRARQVALAIERPDLLLVGASAHSVGELRAAEQIGADFAVLGPVRRTPSHPDRNAIGWEGFRDAVRDTAIPVFALGGVDRADMRAAWSCGAHGVAMVRGAWRDE